MESNSGGRVLVVDDHPTARQSVIDALTVLGLDVVGCESARPALQHLRREPFDLIMTDLMMPGMDGLQFLKEVSSLNVHAQTIMMTAHGSVATAVEAMRHGAFDYVEKPFDVDQLESVVKAALQEGAVVGKRCEILDGQSELLVGHSPALQLLKQRIEQVASSDVTVLVTGESGTGKELVARSIHLASSRQSQPLVSLNCPALSPQLMESELFGHEQGAFTHAVKSRVGRFELADRGTIFLDEVTEIELGLQAKLLRVLQERTIERVGSSEVRPVDVRVIAATNRDLQEEVREGRFRDDLFFRLAVVPLPVPPLRDRKEDIAELANHFLKQAASRCGMPPRDLDDSAIDRLTDYDWPGNVRELENVITRATVLTPNRLLTADDVQPEMTLSPTRVSSTAARPPQPTTSEVPVGTRLQDMERTLIVSTLQKYDGHREKTASALGIGVRTLSNKLRSYGYGPREMSFQARGTRSA
jgi:DNA-binding NtrC family response regulator